MSQVNKNADTSFDYEDNQVDRSVNDARWLLGGVATLGLFVMAIGLLASTLAV